jgi:multidrug efflux system membrane fusion protein
MRLLKWTIVTLAVLALGTVAGVRIAGDRLGGGGAKAAAPAAGVFSMPVPVVSVTKQTLPIYLSYPGRIEAIRGVSLQPRISGYIDSQPAADGADVKSGDLLYRIDPRDMQAALDQARAQTQRDNASLEYAQANFSRGQELLKSGNVTKDSFDQRSSTMRVAEAALALDQAALEAATLNLSYAEIRAPFSGRLGRNLAAKGALVGPATGALNTLVQLDPVYVTFNPSESELTEIERARASGTVEAEVSTPGEPSITRKGQLSFLDNVIDRSTGTIVARVTIENHDFALLPGQYIRVRLLIRNEPDALMAPVAALGSNQMGKYVYVVGQGDKAEMRPLELGPNDGPLVSVKKGLSEGDRVIVGNLQKIGPGSPVQALPSEKKATP